MKKESIEKRKASNKAKKVKWASQTIMKKETIEKRKASNKAKKERWASQTISVDEQWRIVRIDEYNWQIQRFQKGEWNFWPRENFFGRLIDALKALPATLLHVEASGSLAELVRIHTGILKRIDAALP